MTVVPARLNPGERALWDGIASDGPRRHTASDALGMLNLVQLVLAVLRAACRSRTDLVVEHLVLRHHPGVLTRPTRWPRVRFRRLDKLLWVLICRLRHDWRRHLVVVRPTTVVRWHRRGWWLFWRWRSRSRLGRPRLSPEVRELIATMARDNPRWGSERIRGELRKLGIVVSKRSNQRYRGRGPARPPSQTWRTFLRNHAGAIWAADLLTVQTLTFRVLYVLVAIAHGRREQVHVAVTAHPTATWVWRQVVEATAWGRRPRFLLRDRDSVYGGDFSGRLAAVGIEQLLTPVRAPRAIAVVERLVGTLRRECLNHLIVVNERHLGAVLTEFAGYYNGARPHRRLGLETPLPADRLAVRRRTRTSRSRASTSMSRAASAWARTTKRSRSTRTRAWMTESTTG
jgi:transposase InsO family protein